MTIKSVGDRVHGARCSIKSLQVTPHTLVGQNSFSSRISWASPVALLLLRGARPPVRRHTHLLFAPTRPGRWS
jgi:hypothetical protein